MVKKSILTLAILVMAGSAAAQNADRLAGASADNPVDATWLLVNPSFETGDETGWTLTGRDPNGNVEFCTTDRYDMSGKAGKFLMNAYQWWASLLAVSQTVENVPSGHYEVSAVVATWEGRTVDFTAGGTTVTTAGRGDQTGLKVTVPVTIGNDQTLTISCGSTGQWWVPGHEGEVQTFFKVDDVRLVCRGLFLNGYALPLPNDDTTPLKAGQWYYHDIDYYTDYLLKGPLDGLVYSLDGGKTLDEITVAPARRQMTLAKGRVYFKPDREGQTLTVTPVRSINEGSFRVAALNVDGLPQNVGNIKLNADGPGSEGTQKISRYLAAKGYDLIGVSEDFNYHGSLISALMGNYSWGKERATLSAENISWLDLLQGKIKFDTDGLNLLWKKSTTTTANESWEAWTSTFNGEGNQYVKKGFRHYDVTIDGNALIDVYVLHMDAGDTDATDSRHAQWRQLAAAVNNADPNRPKLIIGDTNSRWTREDINANFASRLNAGLTMADAWVELHRGGVCPTPEMNDLTDQSSPTAYANYEVVDKLIYINPTTLNTTQLAVTDVLREQDYTYGTVDGDGNAKPLGDHRPVVATFAYKVLGAIAPVPGAVKGDVNLDGRVDIVDVVCAVSHLQGQPTADCCLWTTDINDNGIIDGDDVTAIVTVVLQKNP